jgi:hypothetical protein
MYLNVQYFDLLRGALLLFTMLPLGWGAWMVSTHRGPIGQRARGGSLVLIPHTNIKRI